MPNKKFLIITTLSLLMLLAACSTEAAEETSEEVADDVQADDESVQTEDDSSAEESVASNFFAAMESQRAIHESAVLPDEYVGLVSPLDGNEADIAAGAEIFTTNCETCHGASGEGDGPTSAGYDPLPANLAITASMGHKEDDYFFWRITEGGAGDPFNSAMIAWGGILSEEEIWQVIAYIRTLESDMDMPEDMEGMGDHEGMGGMNGNGNHNGNGNGNHNDQP